MSKTPSGVVEDTVSSLLDKINEAIQAPLSREDALAVLESVYLGVEAELQAARQEVEGRGKQATQLGNTFREVKPFGDAMIKMTLPRDLKVDDFQLVCSPRGVGGQYEWKFRRIASISKRRRAAQGLKYVVHYDGITGARYLDPRSRVEVKLDAGHQEMSAS